jgi:lipopolysaccharide/colanic/teichoic acid biosynthesis glycosyltransferase
MPHDDDRPFEETIVSVEALPAWKRVVDLVCCVAALPLLGLITFFLGFVVVFLAKGPVFFRQEKIGYQGRRFWVYRFRTMRVDSEPLDWPKPRAAEALIPGGRFLRATGLGELPQIFSVFRGEMSVVGPRPVSSKNLESMSPFLERGLANVPGVTGLAPLALGRRSGLVDAVQLDLHYAANRSFLLDLRILASTTMWSVRRAIGAALAVILGAKAAEAIADDSAFLSSDSRRPW